MLLFFPSPSADLRTGLKTQPQFKKKKKKTLISKLHPQNQVQDYRRGNPTNPGTKKKVSPMSEFKDHLLQKADQPSTNQLHIRKSARRGHLSQESTTKSV